jgi:RND family efflux transporter MFP subunit
MLFRIDPSDYEAAVAARAADLATAELSLAQEQALAEQAAADWEAMGEGEASGLTLRKPQLAQAQALIASAKAALKRAKRDLDRTEIRAPYDGLVLSKSVDLGQYAMANPANPVARIYATDTAEVRLPLAQREAEFLIEPSERESRVILQADGPSGRREWTARFVRFEATVDPASRLIYAVAELDTPFDKGLRRGMFVEASIEGRSLEGVYVLPRYALRGSESIYLVTPEDTLVTRPVDIVKTDAEQAILSGGLEPGDQVATSPIAYFVENMPVEVIANE